MEEHREKDRNGLGEQKVTWPTTETLTGPIGDSGRFILKQEIRSAEGYFFERNVQQDRSENLCEARESTRFQRRSKITKPARGLGLP